MNLNLSIFRYEAKFVGIVMVILSLPFAYLYFWGGRPDAFIVKVFAVVTQYMETRYFVIAQTNVLDELAAILFISGIAIFSFSKEKNEELHFETLRVKALIKAMYTTLGLWLLSFLLIYGMAIFFVSFFVFVIFMINFNILFRVYLLKSKKAKTHPPQTI